MYTLMNLSLPDVEHRLRLPIVDTSSKEQLIDANRNALEHFIDESCHMIPGATIPFDEFLTQFFSSLSATEVSYWNRSTVLTSLPPQFPVGKLANGKKNIGNLSFTPLTDQVRKGRYIIRHGYLILETNG
jgi:hypothetical protein